ncbi:MAG: hypothetical protein AB9903_29600 [Vulcanimicrobiota bacterium]
MFRSNFDNVVGKLEKLRDYKKKKDSVYPSIRLNSILMRTNILNFGRIREFIDEYDIDKVQLREFRIDERHNNNPGEIEKERISSLPAKELQALIISIKEGIEDMSHKGKSIIVPLNLLNEGRVSESMPSAKAGGCSIPFFSQWVDFKGNLKICCGDNEMADIGNLLSESEETLRAKRDEFRSLALKGNCRKSCKMHLNSSTML